MKRLGKSVSIIIALLILVFSVLSVFGVSYYEGDNKITALKGFGSLDWGIDVSGGAKIVLSSTADEATLHSAAKVIEERAVSFGMTDYELYVNESAGRLTFVVPESVDSDYSAEETAALLTAKGYFAIRPGSSYTSMIVDSSDSACFLLPSGDTAETVLLYNDMISSASWFPYSESGVDYYYVNLSFTDEGSSIMSELTNADTGKYYNQTISVWLDDVMLANPKVSETINTGTLTFSGQTFTESKAKLYSAIISSGILPGEFTVVSSDTAEPMAAHASDLIFTVGIIALIAIALIMIIRYKFTGVVSVFALLAQFSLVLAFLTKLFIKGNTFLMTIPGASALALSVILTVFSCVLYGERIKSELQKGTILATAVPSAIERSRKMIFDINVILAILALVGMFMFGTAGLTTAVFGSDAISGIYSFCYVLFIGALINFVTGYFLPQLMLRSLISFNKPSMFGGAK